MNNKEASKIISGYIQMGYTYLHGYCVLQDYRVNGIKLGSNHGLYGWNWTLYVYPQNNIIYCHGYRNFPKGV